MNLTAVASTAPDALLMGSQSLAEVFFNTQLGLLIVCWAIVRLVESKRL